MKNKYNYKAVTLMIASAALVPAARAETGCKDGCEIQKDIDYANCDAGYEGTVQNAQPWGLTPLGEFFANLAREGCKSSADDNQTSCKAACPC
jgi:hypothetical protein